MNTSIKSKNVLKENKKATNAVVKKPKPKMISIKNNNNSIFVKTKINNITSSYLETSQKIHANPTKKRNIYLNNLNSISNNYGQPSSKYINNALTTVNYMTTVPNSYREKRLKSRQSISITNAKKIQIRLNNSNEISLQKIRKILKDNDQGSINKTNTSGILSSRIGHNKVNRSIDVNFNGLYSNRITSAFQVDTLPIKEEPVEKEYKEIKNKKGLQENFNKIKVNDVNKDFQRHIKLKTLNSLRNVSIPKNNLKDKKTKEMKSKLDIKEKSEKEKIEKERKEKEREKKEKEKREREKKEKREREKREREKKDKMNKTIYDNKINLDKDIDLDDTRELKNSVSNVYYKKKKIEIKTNFNGINNNIKEKLKLFSNRPIHTLANENRPVTTTATNESIPTTITTKPKYEKIDNIKKGILVNRKYNINNTNISNTHHPKSYRTGTNTSRLRIQTTCSEINSITLKCGSEHKNMNTSLNTSSLLAKSSIAPVCTEPINPSEDDIDMLLNHRDNWEKENKKMLVDNFDDINTIIKKLNFKNCTMEKEDIFSSESSAYQTHLENFTLNTSGNRYNSAFKIKSYNNSGLVTNSGSTRGSYKKNYLSHLVIS